MQWLMSSPNLFGGTPTSPMLWNYMRCESQLPLDPFHTFAIEEKSPMRNLRHVPVYHVYSTQDPITYLPPQNALLASYLTAKNYDVTSQATPGTLHSWSLLNTSAAFDWAAGYTLETEPATFEIDADREGAWYWADVKPWSSFFFATFAVETTPQRNHLTVKDIRNVQSLRLTPPCETLDATENWVLDYNTNEPGSPTTIVVSGVGRPPTYLLRGKSVHTDWTYDPESTELTIHPTLGWFNSSIEVRFDSYTATLDAPSSVGITHFGKLSFQAHVPFQPFFAMIGLEQETFPLDAFDPGDDRYWLVDFTPAWFWHVDLLDANGAFEIPFVVPNDPTLVGKTLRAQFGTFPSADGSALIGEIAMRRDIQITGP